MSSGERALQAFRRLLKEAQRSDRAKVDAVLAFSQRTFIVPSGEAGELYTLVNEAGRHALPLFSARDELQHAAAELDWEDEDGFVPHRELTAAQAMRCVFKQKLDRLVIDVMAPNALEIDRDEIAPLLEGDRNPEDAGPFISVGRVSTSLMQRVKPPSITPPSGLYRSDPPPARSRSSPPLATGFTLEALAAEPATPLLRALAAVLQRYPEVEWAAYCHAHASSYDGSAVGVRIDPGFRTRLRQIAADLRECATRQGSSLEVVLLDDPDLIRCARDGQHVFFPWTSSRNSSRAHAP